MNSMVTMAGILAKTPKILSNSQNELIENVVFSFLYACKLLSLSISCFKMVSYLSSQRDQTEHAMKMLFNHEGRLGNRKQTFFIFFFLPNSYRRSFIKRVFPSLEFFRQQFK